MTSWFPAVQPLTDPPHRIGIKAFSEVILRFEALEEGNGEYEHDNMSQPKNEEKKSRTNFKKRMRSKKVMKKEVDSYEGRRAMKGAATGGGRERVTKQARKKGKRNN